MSSTTSLSREELYERVWTTPMTKLAELFGLSDRGLAKLCERHKIPVPGRGYWQRKEAGQPVKRPRLAAAQPQQILVTRTPAADEPDHPKVSEQIAYEEVHPIRVADRLARPHTLVARTRDHLQSRKPDIDGTLRTFGPCLRVRVSPAEMPRALRILDAFVKAFEERGFTITIPDERHQSTKILIDGEEISVGLEEHSRRTDHILTAREEAERRQGKGWSIPRYDYAPTGVLTFTIHEYAEGLRCRWSDRKNRRLESCLNEIIVALVRIAVTVLRPRRLEHEREQRRWLVNERRRQREDERLSALQQNLEAWRRNQELRSFLSDVEKTAVRRSGEISEGAPVSRWLRWAHDLANRTDPLDPLVANLSRGKWSAPMDLNGDKRSSPR